MAWNMSDDKIKAALSQRCIACPAEAGEECIDIVTGLPLLESKAKRPVHIARLEP